MGDTALAIGVFFAVLVGAWPVALGVLALITPRGRRLGQGPMDWEMRKSHPRSERETALFLVIYALIVLALLWAAFSELSN